MDESIVKGLVNNSKSAIYSAIEIHNKPIFPYRYEVSTILIVNGWELLLKAFIMTNWPNNKMIDKDGYSKPFDECNAFVFGQLGNDFRTSFENLKLIYEYRCRIVHFYEERMDVLLFSLMSKNVILYYDFLLKYFGIDVSIETNLHLMPIGFKRPVSPIDFISNESEISKTSESVQNYIKSIVEIASKMEKDGVEDSSILNYKMSVINENRVKNADIVAAITKSKTEATINVENVIGEIHLTNEETAKRFKVDEESLYEKIYTETYNDVIIKSKEKYTDFSINKNFHSAGALVGVLHQQALRATQFILLLVKNTNKGRKGRRQGLSLYDSGWSILLH